MDITIPCRATCPIDADQIRGCLEHVISRSWASCWLYPVKVRLADAINKAAYQRILSRRIIASLEDEIRRLKGENLDLRHQLRE